MNYNDWQKEFDDRFVADGSFKVQGNYLEVKDFIKEYTNALCEELKMEERIVDDRIDSYRPKDMMTDDEYDNNICDSGFNQAVGRINKKLERIRNEPN